MTEHVTHMSERGLTWLAVLEGGYRLTAYRDSGGAWTISSGLTFYPHAPAGHQRVREGDVLALEQARLLFGMVVRQFEGLVDSVTRDDLQQQEFDALVALAYNIGAAGFRTSTVVRRINFGPFWNGRTPEAEATREGIREAWRRWRYDDGVEVPGLLNRRDAELRVFFDGNYTDQAGRLVPEAGA